MIVVWLILRLMYLISYSPIWMKKKNRLRRYIEGKTNLDAYVKVNFNNFAYYLVLDFVHLNVSLDTNQTENNNLTILILFLYVFVK